MGVYMNVAVIAKDIESGQKVLVKNIANAYNSNILRDYFRDEDIGAMFSEKGDYSPSLEKWLEGKQAYYMSDFGFEKLYADIDKKIETSLDRLDTITSIQPADEVVYRNMMEDISYYEYLVYGSENEPGLQGIKLELIRLEAIAKYLAEDYYSATDTYVPWGDGQIQIAWWMG